MTTATAYVHPAPSPALHALNTPEGIDHNAAHLDSLATYATPEADYEESHADFAFTPAGLPEAPPEPLPVDGLVYESSDYERFHLLPENRDIDFKHLRKLVGLLGQKNMLHLKPIDVTPEGGIIDGQHRWAAARELGISFFYRVGETLTEADITALNIAQKNWTGIDYLHYWTVKGAPAYQMLTAFRERHPRISFSNAKMMLSEPGLNAVLDDFNAGRWVAADEDAAEQVAQLMERIKEETGFKKTTHTRFVAALYRAVKKEGFDADRLMRKLNMQPRALKQAATDRQYLEMLQELYNYKALKEDHLIFI
jgi:hypothetical protein